VKWWGLAGFASESAIIAKKKSGKRASFQAKKEQETTNNHLLKQGKDQDAWGKGTRENCLTFIGAARGKQG